MEEVAAKVIQANETTKLFQTMAIVSLNMGNLNLEVTNLKNRLATKVKEKAILHVELDKERDFQREYKHNI
jgi:regulator of replication initiation timing